MNEFGSEGYIPNLHIILVGDRTIAAGYVPAGKKMVAYIIRSPQYADTRIVTLSGVRIIAKKLGSVRWLTIDASEGSCVLYVESGCAQMGEYMHNRPNASDPAVIQLGSSAVDFFGELRLSTAATFTLPDSVSGITQYDNASPPNQLPGKTKFKSGEYSPRAFYCRPRLSSAVPSTDAFDATEGSGAAGEFPICIALEQKKKVVSKVVPSIYSGKLRLFVQSVFGAALSRPVGVDAVQVDETSLPNRLKLGTTILDLSHGIYSSSDGSYWLIDLNGTTSRITRINLTPCGRALSAWIVSSNITDRKLRSKYEAFVFADASIDPAFSFTLAEIPSVQPIAYGWKFNWDGSEAKCVSMRPAGTGNNTYSESSIQTVTISRNSGLVFTPEQESLSEIQKERLRWSVVGDDSGVLAAFNFPQSTVFVWQPLWIYMRHNRFSGYNPTLVAKIDSGDIYGWYDGNDEFKKVRFNYGTTQNISTHTGPASVTPGGIMYCGMSNVIHDTNTSLTSHSFQVGGDTITITAESGTYASSSFGVSMPGTEYEPADYVSPKTDPSPTPGDGYETTTPSLTQPWVISGGSAVWDASIDAATLEVMAQFAVKKADADAQFANVVSRYGVNLSDSTATQIASLGYGGGTVPAPPDPNDPAHISDPSGVVYTSSSLTDTALKNGSIALVIPFFDSEAVYIFRNQSDTSSRTGVAETGYCHSKMLQTRRIRYDQYMHDEVPVHYYGETGFWYEPAYPYEKTSVYHPPLPALPLDVDASVKLYGKDFLATPAVADNWGTVIDPAWASTSMGDNSCWTFSSAVYNYVHGSNVTPSQPAFSVGTFIGWF